MGRYVSFSVTHALSWVRSLLLYVRLFSREKGKLTGYKNVDYLCASTFVLYAHVCRTHVRICMWCPSCGHAVSHFAYVCLNESGDRNGGRQRLPLLPLCHCRYVDDHGNDVDGAESDGGGALDES